MSKSIHDLSQALYLLRDHWAHHLAEDNDYLPEFKSLMDAAAPLLAQVNAEFKALFSLFEARFTGSIKPSDLGLDALTQSQNGAIFHQIFDGVLSLDLLVHGAKVTGNLALYGALKGEMEALRHLILAHRGRLWALRDSIEPLLAAHPPSLMGPWQALETVLALPPEAFWLPERGEYPALDAALRDDLALDQALFPQSPQLARQDREFGQYWTHFLRPHRQSHAMAMGTVVDLGWSGPVHHRLEFELGPAGQRLGLQLQGNRQITGQCLSNRENPGRRAFFYGHVALEVSGPYDGKAYPIDISDGAELQRLLLKEMRTWPASIRHYLALAAQSQIDANTLRERLQKLHRHWRQLDAPARYAVIAFTQSLVSALPTGPRAALLLRMAGLKLIYQWRSQDWTQSHLKALQNQLKAVHP